MRVSVPGKAFLCGEFVAVDAAPAVVTAVSKRVEATFETREAPGWGLHSSVDGFTDRHLEELLAAPPTNDLLASAVQSVVRAGLTLPEGLNIEIDSSALTDVDGNPTGLGSSAAGSVALVMGLMGSSAACEVTAAEAHRAFQGGLGSGYDVVSCCRGGTQVIRRGHEGPFDAVECATGLEMEVMLALGETALSTTAVLQIVERAQFDTAEVLAEMAIVAAEFSDAFLQRDPAAVVGHAHRFFELEVRLGRRIGVDVVPESVQRLSTALGPLSSACKPSGAGGDGLVVVFAPRERAEAVQEVVQGSGFRVLDAEIGAPGVRVRG